MYSSAFQSVASRLNSFLSLIPKADAAAVEMNRKIEDLQAKNEKWVFENKIIACA